MDFKPYVRKVDGPHGGPCRQDLTALLADARAFRAAVKAMAEPVRTLEATHVLGLEAGGFIFGGALAQALGLAFVSARKPGHLAPDALREAWEGGALEIALGALRPGARVLIVDDLLATGATAAAARRLVERAGAQPLALTLLLEADHLPGREMLKGLPVFSVLRV